jgi:drug/metabolite transporter (DMT)-like permease
LERDEGRDGGVGAHTEKALTSSRERGPEGLATLAPYAFVLLWSSSFLTARIGLRLVTPLLFVAVRLVAAAIILFAVMAARGESWAPLRGRWYHLAIAGALVNGLTLAPFHVGMVTVDAAVMALVQAMSPLLIALLGGPLLGERLRATQWLGILLGLAGVLLVVGPRAAQSQADLAAILLGLLGVLGLAGGTLYFGRWGRGVPLLPATAVQLGSAAVLVLLAMLLFETPQATWSATAVASVAWNVAVVSIGGMSLYYFMLNRGAAGRVAANFYLVPGVVALLGWWLLAETLAPLAIGGLALASLGVWLTQSRRETG